jgi:hypothetical protein
MKKLKAMESIESEDEPGSSTEHPHKAAKEQTRDIMARIMAEKEDYGTPPLECSKLMESQEVNLEVSTKEGMQRFLAQQMMQFHFNFDF